MTGVRSTLTALAVILLAAPAYAQTLTLHDALAAARLSDVITAELGAADAERAQRRTEADPLALRIDRVQAAQEARRAQDALHRARLQADREVAEAFVQALQARAQRELAERAAALSERSLAIAELRQERGAATELDVREAGNDLADAAANVAAARQGEALARLSLKSLLDLPWDDLAPVPDALLAIPVPDEEELLAAMRDSGPLLQVALAQELAQVAREMLDPAYAPRAQIDQAELGVEQAREAAREAERGMALLVRSLLDRVEAARDALATRREALAAAEDRLAVERSRLQAGLIAEVAFDAAALQTEQARLAHLQARHDLLLALFTLQAETGASLEGLRDPDR